MRGINPEMMGAIREILGILKQLTGIPRNLECPLLNATLLADPLPSSSSHARNWCRSQLVQNPGLMTKLTYSFSV